MVAADVRVENITLPFVDPLDLGNWGIPLTLFGLVAVMNVVNFTDGVDGLAAGVCTIAAATFACIALSLDRVDAGVLAAIVAGAALGFLRHNFHPASVFMGDSGSNLLGLLLGCVAIQGVLKTAAVVALFFPLVILAVPALDATFVVAKRIKYRRPVYSADRWHFHHRFANIGFSTRRTVVYLYAWTVSLAALALALRFVPYSQDDGQLNAGWAAGHGGLRGAGGGRQPLPGLRARAVQVPPLPRAPVAPRRDERPRDPRGDRARGGDRRVRHLGARPPVSTPEITVADATERGQFEIAVDGQPAGFAVYQRLGTVIAFTHTQIDDSFEGQGLGGRLDLLRAGQRPEAGCDVLPYCPFVRGYIERHPQYLDLVPARRRAEFDLPAEDS